MKVDIFDFDLDKDLIAKMPANPRDTSRLLDFSAPDKINDLHFYDLPKLLKAGDVMVFNDTKVIPARLYGQRGEALVEVTLYHPDDGISWWSFIKNSKRLHVGDIIRFYTDEICADDSTFAAEVVQKDQEDGVLIKFNCAPDDLNFWNNTVPCRYRRILNETSLYRGCGIATTTKKTTKPYMPNTKVRLLRQQPACTSLIICSSKLMKWGLNECS